ncbi:MAG TPA: ABC transporter substrate-binding protein [Gemmatimonadaceae bacterium]|nr:ABC transporter substrate-binding protein [Gemmatimonadaceae bacterium]
MALTVGLALTLVLALGTGVAGARPDAPAAAPANTLVITQGVDPRTLSPWTSIAAELSVTTQIFERLIAYDYAKKEFVPALAQSWRFVNPTTLEITVRRKITFSNGEPLSGDAVVFSFRQLLNPTVGGRELSNRTANIDRVQKIGPRSIRITFKKPVAQAINLANLAQSAFMVPPRYYRRQGHTGFATNPIGTGPYQLESRVRDSRIVLKKNPRYAGFSGPAPRPEKVEFRILPEPGARVAALRAGDVDIVVDVPPDNVASLRNARNVRVVTPAGLRVMEMQVDMRWGMSDATPKLAVRQALLYALDRQRIINAVFLGLGRPANQLTTPAYVGYQTDLPQLSYNPNRVRQLLTQAGYPNGLSLQMECPSGRYLKDREVCEVIAAELGRVGIRVSLKIHEVGAFFQGVLAHNKGPLIYIGRLAPSLNALDSLNSSLCASTDSYKCDPTLDRLRERALAAKTAEQQAKLTAQAVRREAANPVRIPLWYLNDVYGTSTRLQGWRSSPDQVIQLWGVRLAS